MTKYITLITLLGALTACTSTGNATKLRQEPPIHEETPIETNVQIPV